MAGKQERESDYAKVDIELLYNLFKDKKKIFPIGELNPGLPGTQGVF